MESRLCFVFFMAVRLGNTRIFRYNFVVTLSPDCVRTKNDEIHITWTTFRDCTLCCTFGMRLFLSWCWVNGAHVSKRRACRSRRFVFVILSRFDCFARVIPQINIHLHAIERAVINRSKRSVGGFVIECLGAPKEGSFLFKEFECSKVIIEQFNNISLMWDTGRRNYEK